MAGTYKAMTSGNDAQELMKVTIRVDERVEFRLEAAEAL